MAFNEVPNRSCESLLTAEACNLRGVEHAPHLVEVGVELLIVVGQLEKLAQRFVRKHNLAVSHKGESFGESFEDLEPLVKCLVTAGPTQECLLAQLLNLVGDNTVAHDAEDATRDHLIAVITADHTLCRLNH